MKQRVVPFTQYISVFCVALLFGLVQIKVFVWTLNPSVLLVCGVASLPVILRTRPIISLVPILLIGFGLGVARADGFSQQLQIYTEYENTEIHAKGVVQTDPVYASKGQIEFYINDVHVENKAAPGRIRVRTYDPQPKRGDEVTVEGTLRSGFASWQGSMYYASIVELQPTSSSIEQLRARFIAHIYSVIPEPEASLGLGFLIGIRTLLPEDLEEQLSKTGLTHIVAVSGYNLTILLLCMRNILFRFSRFTAVAGSVVVLIIFLLIAGFSPSIVRASAVVGLSLLAWYYGRKFRPTLLLFLTAAITAYISPLYIWGDLGWYLSFLAFAGVLIIAPLVTSRIYKKRSPKIIEQVAIETTAAQLTTLPLILFIFGQLSVISLLANVVILPLIPLAMLGTFLSGLAQLLGGTFAWIVVWPTVKILTFITNMISILAGVSWSLIPLKLTYAQFMVCIILLIFFVIILKRTTKITDTNL